MLSYETDSERVTAEITTADVLRIAREVGMPVSAKEAQLFLRDGSRAHRMWKQMVEISGDPGESLEEYDA